MKKIDIISSLVIGELTAWLALSVIKNLMPNLPYTWTLPVALPFVFLFSLWLAFLIGKKIPLIWQAAKFLMVGVLNTLVDLGVLALVSKIALNNFRFSASDILLNILSVSVTFYSLYKAISFIMAAINSFFWNKFWTFKRGTNEKVGKEFLQFFIVTFIGFLINVSIASLVFANINPLAGLDQKQWEIMSAVVATAASMVWNFVGYKFIVFRQSAESAS